MKNLGLGVLHQHLAVLGGHLCYTGPSWNTTGYTGIYGMAECNLSIAPMPISVMVMVVLVVLFVLVVVLVGGVGVEVVVNQG